MKNILFYDNVCPNSYDDQTLLTKSLGGTEASCIRIVEALAKDPSYCVRVQQRGRTEAHISAAGVIYEPLDTPIAKVHATITLRDANSYLQVKAKYPNATHYLWMHDVVSGPYREHLAHFLNNQDVKMICVSEWHKLNIIDALRDEAIKGRMRVHVIYGPLADYCIRKPVTIDRNKLVFFSSPHKGLDYVLQIFTYLRNIDPYFKLYVANPGYFKDHDKFPTGVINLGVMPKHEDVIDQVRDALCTFYPNISFAETFGLVMAESNAVGTPVIAHRIGAAPEVLEHPAQLMDCRDYKKVVDTVIKWKNGERPVVRGRPEFTLGEVVKQWKKLLG